MPCWGSYHLSRGEESSSRRELISLLALKRLEYFSEDWIVFSEWIIVKEECSIYSFLTGLSMLSWPQWISSCHDGSGFASKIRQILRCFLGHQVFSSWHDGRHRGHDRCAMFIHFLLSFWHFLEFLSSSTSNFISSGFYLYLVFKVFN
jgi:hypothetical protein